jgi:hypothetical protein
VLAAIVLRIDALVQSRRARERCGTNRATDPPPRGGERVTLKRRIGN